MRLYDTLSRETRELKPLDGEIYRFYCCGPTVYGPAHIGNFRTFVIQDVFRRTLEIGGIKTKHVRNLTDLDDKTIRDSQAAGMTLKDFTDGWTEKFHTDCAALNCLTPHIEPSAVEHIPHQIKMIENLIEKGNAYASEDGSVYFKISSFPDYGQLSHLDMRELELGKTANSRSDSDEYEKDNLADFVLWKGRRDGDGDNYWQSPWGEGRPGWHLECSAMILEYLGTDFDMHAGGEDLVFPHHDNEIAQSKCACGGEFAAHWFHSTHLLVDGGKMAKSKGNFYVLGDLQEKGFTASEVRYALIGAHYQKQQNFTLDSLHAAREALLKLAKAEKALAEKAGVSGAPAYEDLIGLEDKGLFANAWSGLNEDLNTQRAIGAMFGSLKHSLNEDNALIQWKGLHCILASLGIQLPSLEVEKVEVPAEVEELAVKRWEAKQAKDWAASDVYRDELKALGWVVKDGSDGYEVLPL